MTAERDLERALEDANAALEQAVIDALGARKGLPDRQRREELKAGIWRRRLRVVELERDRLARQLAEARREADAASARQDHDEYLRAIRKLARLRVRYLNAVDLLDKLRADGPGSSARLL